MILWFLVWFSVSCNCCVCCRGLCFGVCGWEVWSRAKEVMDNFVVLLFQTGPKSLPGTLEALTLARWIFRSYRIHTGAELFLLESPSGDAVLKQLWNHPEEIMYCFVKTNASPVFTFANQAGLDMLETTLVALQDIMLNKILDEAGRKVFCSEFTKIMH